MPLRVEDKIMITKLVAEIDKKNSYYYNEPVKIIKQLIIIYQDISKEEHWDLRKEIYEADMIEQQADMLISLEEELQNEEENSFIKEITSYSKK